MKNLFIAIILTLAFVAATTAAGHDGLIRARLKYNPDTTRLDKRDAQFNASLFNNKRVYYLLQVDIGTPTQSFTATLDTGSSDLWVPSTNCPSTICPLKRFDATASSTFTPLNEPFSVRYALGNASGTYVKDTVSIGGASVSGQQFGLASTTQKILESRIEGMGTNGVFGLGYPLAGGAADPFVFSLAAKGILQEPIFSIFLNSVRKPDYAGELLLGGIDDSKFDGDLVYLPVVQAVHHRRASAPFFLYWMVYAHGVGMSTSQTSHRFPNVGAFILDTGATLTYMPSAIAADAVASIAGPGNYQLAEETGVYWVKCSVAQQESNAHFELHMLQDEKNRSNPVVVSVPASELVLPLDADTAEEATTCIFGIASSDHLACFGGDDMYLIGDTVLRSLYMVFDMGKNRVGLASSRGVGGNVTGGDPSFQALNVVGRPIQLVSGVVALSVSLNLFVLLLLLTPMLIL